MNTTMFMNTTIQAFQLHEFVDLKANCICWKLEFELISTIFKKWKETETERCHWFAWFGWVFAKIHEKEKKRMLSWHLQAKELHVDP
jgi:hypothetical protein